MVETMLKVLEPFSENLKVMTKCKLQQHPPQKQTLGGYLHIFRPKPMRQESLVVTVTHQEKILTTRKNKGLLHAVSNISYLFLAITKHSAIPSLETL